MMIHHENQPARLILAAAVLCLFAGCNLAPRDRMADAQKAYDAGQYRKAYNNAVQAVHVGTTATPDQEAAYLAGMSAYRIRSFRDADTYLNMAAAGRDRKIAGQALATQGAMYVEQERYHQASQTLVKAAETLDGQDRANAYLNAARSDLRLSRWASARSYLTLAREHSRDEVFRRSVEAMLGANGFTIQIGAYTDETYANQVANHLATAAQSMQIGAPRVLRIAQPDGSVKYHVQVGQFSLYDTAAQKRRALGYNDAVVVLLGVGAAQ